MFIITFHGTFFYMNRFADKQIIKLQETPDEIPEGGTPHTVSVLMHDKLVDAGKPGDRVEVRIELFLVISIINPDVVLVYANYQFIPFFLLLQITGIYRAMSIRVGPAQRTVKSIFKVKIQALLHSHVWISTIALDLGSEVLCDDVPSFSDCNHLSFRRILIVFT
jgi:hypothetical protein